MTVEQVRQGEQFIQWIIGYEQRVEQLEAIIKRREEYHDRHGFDGQYEWITIRDYNCKIDAKFALDILKSELDKELEQLEITRRELFEL